MKEGLKVGERIRGLGWRIQVWPGAKDPEKAGQTYSVPLSRVVYIEASDFQLEDSKDYYGLALNKTVLLKYALPRSLQLRRTLTQLFHHMCGSSY